MSFDPRRHKWREVTGDPGLALTVTDPHSHFECGGPNGGIAFFGTHTKNGLLYELTDEQGKVAAPVTIETLVADWEANAV